MYRVTTGGDPYITSTTVGLTQASTSNLRKRQAFSLRRLYIKYAL